MKLAEFMTPFKVGLLVIAGFAALIAMVIALTGDFSMADTKSNRYYAMFDDVTGLAMRSRIQLAGIPVGTIEDIRLVGSRARIEILVRDDIAMHKGIDSPSGKHFKNGATIAKRQASLIGDYYLEITPGTEGPVLASGDQIHNVIVAVGPEELFDRLNDITRDIQAVTNSLATVFGSEDAQKSVQQMMDDMQNILATVNRLVDTNSPKLDQVVNDAANISRDIAMLTQRSSDSLEIILRDTEAIVQEVRFIIGQSTSDVQAGLGTLQGTLGRLQRTLDSLNYSLQNVQDITEKINEGEGTLGELVNNPAIALRTEQILDDTGDFIGRISRLQTIVELRSEYHSNASQLKNVFGLRLQPQEGKYYLLELIDDFRGKTHTEIERVHTTDASAEDAVFQETRVTTTDDFKISLLLARGYRFNDALMITGRVGILESSGGFGFQLGLLPNSALEIQTDLFNFGQASNPRLRSFATYQFLGFAFISAGLDDILNSDRRDYFIGAGIRFNDEDLKTILGTTGVPAL